MDITRGEVIDYLFLHDDDFIRGFGIGPQHQECPSILPIIRVSKSGGRDFKNSGEPK
jgi:hypothetical protein